MAMPQSSRVWPSVPRKVALERSGRARSNSLLVCSATWVRGARALVARARVDENIVAESPSNEWGAFQGAEPPETRPKVVPARGPEAKPGAPCRGFPGRSRASRAPEMAAAAPLGTAAGSLGRGPAYWRLLERSSLYLKLVSLTSESSSMAKPTLPKRCLVGPIWISQGSTEVFGNLTESVLPMQRTSIG